MKFKKGTVKGLRHTEDGPQLVSFNGYLLTDYELNGLGMYKDNNHLYLIDMSTGLSIMTTDELNRNQFFEVFDSDSKWGKHEHIKTDYLDVKKKPFYKERVKEYKKLTGRLF